jgi:hypothetical protein
MAQAINYEQPKVMRQAPAKGKKAVKPVKAKKVKLVLRHAGKRIRPDWRTQETPGGVLMSKRVSCCVPVLP